MGMNTILILIAGIVMSTMVATQVAPSIVEGVKVKKVQTQTINNQEVIFEAIKRYITMQQKAPGEIKDLTDAGYLDEKVNNNGFGVEHIIDSEKYTIHVDKALGVATITTTIVDPKAQEAFLNSFMGTSKPSCKVDEHGICVPNKFETKYVLPNEVMHGNALLMTGIPIQSTPPDSNINKYWYDTSSGKATLKIYDNDSSSWIEVNLGSSEEGFLPGEYTALTLPRVSIGGVDGVRFKDTKVYEIIPSKSGSFLIDFNSTCSNSSVLCYMDIHINGKKPFYINRLNFLNNPYSNKFIIFFKANDKIEIILNYTGTSLKNTYSSFDIIGFKIRISPDTNYPISYTASFTR